MFSILLWPMRVTSTTVHCEDTPAFRLRKLGGSWDLVSTVISTLIQVIGDLKDSYLIYHPSY